MGKKNIFLQIKSAAILQNDVFEVIMENNLMTQLFCCECGSCRELEQKIKTIGSINTTFKGNSLTFKIS